MFKTFKVQVHDRDYRLPNNLSKLAEGAFNFPLTLCTTSFISWLKELGPDGELSTDLNPTAPYGQASFSKPFTLCHIMTCLNCVGLVELSSGVTNVELSSQIVPVNVHGGNS